MYDMHLFFYEAKLSNLKMKTRSKHFLSKFPLDIAMENFIWKDETWAEFSALEVTASISSIYVAMKQNSLL